MSKDLLKRVGRALGGNGGGSARTGRRRLRGRSAGALLAAAMLLGSGLAAHAADCKTPAAPSRDWSGCNRSNLVLSGENLEGADLHGTDLGMSNLSDVALSGANLQGAKLGRTSLAGAVAEKADFTSVEGYRTDFSGLSANGASFRGAELQRSNFTNAALVGSTFEKAELGRADFAGAGLGGNVFKFANLARASFKTARIEAPLDFSGAYMFLTRIEGTDLSGATGLTQAQVDLTCGDAETRLPAGLTPPATWPCPFD